MWTYGKTSNGFRGQWAIHDGDWDVGVQLGESRDHDLFPGLSYFIFPNIILEECNKWKAE